MKAPCFLDTNILLYRASTAEAEQPKRRIAEALLHRDDIGLSAQARNPATMRHSPSPPDSAPATPASPLPDAAEILPARMLNEFVYCPRLFYFEHVEGLFRHNADTLRGSAIHRRVDDGKGGLPEAAPGEATAGSGPVEPLETIHARSVSLASDRLGVTARLDLVEISADPVTGRAAAVSPVDYKAGSPRESEEGPSLWDADRKDHHRPRTGLHPTG